MKKLLLLVVIALGTIGLYAQNDTESMDENPVEVSVEMFQKKAADLVGKDIYVTGIVDHVCKHGGKKVMLVSEDGEASLKVMAGDKISKFDKNIEGENLKVLGTVTEFKMDDTFLDEREKKVKEHHKPTDPEYKEDMEWIQEKREEIKKSKKGYLSFYSMDGISYEVVK
ncbi:MAG: hypothetical protein CSB01_01770 [Bacteroidia bacterium]|nr:MAG: hypothetical protein CSB01_01770 [Bacteroidia bacterium]